MATKSIHISDDDYDPTPMLHWLLALALGLAVWVAAIMIVLALMTPAQAADFRLVRFGGEKWYTPPKALTVKIERRMAAGDVPNFRRMSLTDIRKKCPGISPKATGCTALFAVFVRKGLSREAEHFVLVHEYAHLLYDWDHPDRYPADPRLPVEAHL